MATFTGYLPPPDLYFLTPQQGVGQQPYPQAVPLDAIHLAPLLYGDKEVNQPINQLERSISGGWITYSYFEDYYERVWFIPSAVDFGPITAETTFPVFMWNAHLHRVDLDNVTISGDSSLSFGNLPSDLHLNPLGGTYFNVIAGVNGEPIIDAVASFSFDPVELVDLPIQGIRARLWPFRVNWKDGFETALEYKTEIITARAGYEQRIATRQTPRKNFKFSSIANESKFREFIRFANYWQGRSTIVAEATKFGRLQSTALNGQGYLDLVAVPDWMAPGVLVVLMNKLTGEAILRTIDVITGNRVALKSIVTGEWLAGMKVFKGVAGRLAPSIEAVQNTNRTLTIAVDFDADPGLEVYPPNGVAAVTHRGREVLLKRFNWASSPTPTFGVMREEVDYGTGPVDYILPYDFNTRYSKANYTGRDTAEVEEIERFFRRVMGQQGEFFMPTFTEDIRIMSASPATTNSLRIAGPELARDMKNELIYRNLIIFFHDGTYLLLAVQSIFEVTDIVGNDTIIQVGQTFTFDIEPDAIRQICWLPLWRLSSDTLTLSHRTDEAAEFALTMQTLPYEDAE